MPLMINTNVVTKYDEGILIIGLINPSKYFGKLRTDDENMPINQGYILMTDALFNLKYVNINVMRKAIKDYESKDI